nr:unnamed protein product [Digitaria exilis]
MLCGSSQQWKFCRHVSTSLQLTCHHGTTDRRHATPRRSRRPDGAHQPPVTRRLERRRPPPTHMQVEPCGLGAPSSSNGESAEKSKSLPRGNKEFGPRGWKNRMDGSECERAGSRTDSHTPRKPIDRSIDQSFPRRNPTTQPNQTTGAGHIEQANLGFNSQAQRHGPCRAPGVPCSRAAATVDAPPLFESDPADFRCVVSLCRTRAAARSFAIHPSKAESRNSAKEISKDHDSFPLHFLQPTGFSVALLDPRFYSMQVPTGEVKKCAKINEKLEKLEGIQI